VLDIETTGFSAAKDSIVEIGIVELDLYTGATSIIYDQLVKEHNLREQNSQAWVFQNSDLDFAQVWNAKPLEFDIIQDILNHYPITAFNKKFDFTFFRERGFLINELDCPMLLATNVCKIPGKRGYKWPTVEEAWHFFFPGISYIEKHRGADDALHEAKIVHRLYELGVFKLHDEF